MKTLIPVLAVINFVLLLAFGAWVKHDQQSAWARIQELEKSNAAIRRALIKPNSVDAPPTADTQSPDTIIIRESEPIELGSRLEELEKKIAGIEGRLASLDEQVSAANDTLEQVGRLFGAEGKIVAGAEKGDTKKGDTDFTELFDEMVSESMREMAAEEKTKMMKELRTPTIEGEQERLAEIDRMVQQLSNQIQLTEAEKAYLRDVLNREDEKRRKAIGAILNSGRDPSYDEVAKIMDDSYKSQDAQIAALLSTEKYAIYERQQRMKRRFVRMLMKMMFQEPPEKK